MSQVLRIRNDSIGSASWKGDPLHSGYRTFISGREVELDREVSSSQLPDTITVTDEDNGESFDVPSEHGRHPPAPVIENDAPVHVPGPLNTNAASSRFVAPASFYGTTPKHKARQPQ